jgi:hypothetical protein
MAVIQPTLFESTTSWSAAVPAPVRRPGDVTPLPPLLMVYLFFQPVIHLALNGPSEFFKYPLHACTILPPASKAAVKIKLTIPFACFPALWCPEARSTTAAPTPSCPHRWSTGAILSAFIEIRLAIVTNLRGGFPRCLCRALGPSPLHPPPHRFTLGRGDEEGILRRAARPPAAKSPQFPLPSPAGRERGGGQGEG